MRCATSSWPTTSCTTGRVPGITFSGTVDVIVVNNTSMDNGRDGKPFPGLLVDSTHAPNEGLRVINNVVSDIQVNGDRAPDEQAGNVVEGAGAGPMDLTGDPCFADRVEYQLAPQSPAIDPASSMAHRPTTSPARPARRARRRRVEGP